MGSVCCGLNNNLLPFAPLLSSPTPSHLLRAKMDLCCPQDREQDTLEEAASAMPESSRLLCHNLAASALWQAGDRYSLFLQSSFCLNLKTCLEDVRVLELSCIYTELLCVQGKLSSGYLQVCGQWHIQFRSAFQPELQKNSHVCFIRELHSLRVSGSLWMGRPVLPRARGCILALAESNSVTAA